MAIEKNGAEQVGALLALQSAMHKRFEDKPGTHAARLAQLDAAIGTAMMATECLFDEEEREVDLAVRMMNREKVHGDNEVVDPYGGARTIKDHYAIVAGRGK